MICSGDDRVYNCNWLKREVNTISDETHNFDATNKSIKEIIDYLINFQIRKIEMYEDTLNESTENAMSNLIRLIEFKREIDDGLIDYN